MPAKQLTAFSAWYISVESEDGHRVVMAYFTEKRTADEALAKRHWGVHPQVMQTELWERETRAIYEVSQKIVMLDLPSRDDVLKRLTDEEKFVLGIK